MGWIAAAGLSVVAGGILYKVVDACVHTGSNGELKGRTSHILEQQEQDYTVDQRKEETPEINVSHTSQGREGAANGFSFAQKPILGDSLSPTPARQAPKAQLVQNDSLASLAPPSGSPPRLKPPTFGSMPAPPRPSTGGSLRPPPSSASSLRVPPTKVLSNASMAPSSLMPPPNKPSRQVILRPGHSPLDWAMLTQTPNHQLRGKDVPADLIRVPPSALKYHNGRKGRDAWTVYQGKVYNITPYLPFHPGGEGELMRGAAKDAGKLFMEVHPWVNWDGMLGECLVGVLVGEGDVSKNSGGLDDMD